MTSNIQTLETNLQVVTPSSEATALPTKFAIETTNVCQQIVKLGNAGYTLKRGNNTFKIALPKAPNKVKKEFGTIDAAQLVLVRRSETETTYYWMPLSKAVIVGAELVFSISLIESETLTAKIDGIHTEFDGYSSRSIELVRAETTRFATDVTASAADIGAWVKIATLNWTSKARKAADKMLTTS